MKTLPHLTRLLVAAGVLLAGARADAARPRNFEKEMTALAAQVTGACETDVKLKDKRLKLGKFACLDDADSNSGKKIERALTARLAKLIDPASKLILLGEYSFVSSADDAAEGGPAGEKMKVIRVTAVIRLDGQDLFKKSVEVNDTDDIYDLAGLNGAPPLGGSQYERNKAADKAHEKPSFFQDGSKVSIDAAYPVRVEILLKDTVDGPARAAVPVAKNGKAFVAMKPGQYYEIRLHNAVAVEVAAAVSVDGLDTLSAFNKDARKPGYYLVPAHSAVTIRGWMHSAGNEALKANTSLLGFLAGELGGGGPAPIKRAEDVGVMNIAVHASWEKGKEPPPEVLKALARTGKPLETKAGDGLPQDVVLVPREVSPRLGTISLRYGSAD